MCIRLEKWDKEAKILMGALDLWAIKGLRHLIRSSHR